MEQNHRDRLSELLYAVKLDRSTFGLGMIAPAVKSVPVERRQILQWQKWTGIGRLAVGTVKERLAARQWHVARNVRVAIPTSSMEDIGNLYGMSVPQRSQYLIVLAAVPRTSAGVSIAFLVSGISVVAWLSNAT